MHRLWLEVPDDGFGTHSRGSMSVPRSASRTDRMNQLLLAHKRRSPRASGAEGRAITEQFLFATPKSRKHLRTRDSEYSALQLCEVAVDEEDGAHCIAAQRPSVVNNL